SHWQVDSAATTQLMSDAFERFNRAADLTDALRQAQNTLAEDPATSHPFFWAAFTFIGDDQRATRDVTAL
ncbi:MAG: CHAT domain-containing protein, partial [Pseudomonadota bacterium]